MLNVVDDFWMTVKKIMLDSTISHSSKLTEHHDYSTRTLSILCQKKSQPKASKKRGWSHQAVTHSHIKIHLVDIDNKHHCQISQGWPAEGAPQQRSACRFVIPSPEPLDYPLSIDPEEAPRGSGLNTL